VSAPLDRPQPPRVAPPDGTIWAARPDPTWSLTTQPRDCRHATSDGHSRRVNRCGQPATAEYEAGVQTYGYCGEHLRGRYGRWVENAQVMRWLPVPTTKDTP